VNCSIDKVFQDSEKPKQDPEIHAKIPVKKGVGRRQLMAIEIRRLIPDYFWRLF